MSRNFAGFKTSIWSDPDFIAMPGMAQRLYLFLTSQPDLTFAGVVALRPSRWGLKCEDYSTRGVRRDLDVLIDRRYVAVDTDTEELLVRTFVRHSGVWKQPNVMRRMAADMALIDSPGLVAMLHDELTRIPLDELSNEAREGRPSPRKVVASIIDGILHGGTLPGTLPGGAQ